ncbi:MAG TPA: rhomboid family intramembrane serine protease [Solirubrobacteraceae bacterium]|jgi:membrane associated rhomboid family serine protease|nr:rhomboid family intramembrane serine protease [Solirubrobacteraceae bacterium]
MTTTPVGMRCPECARQRTKVHTMRSVATQPRVTYALIAINVLVFVIGGGISVSSGLPGGVVHVDACGPTANAIQQHGALCGPSIADAHEYWRLITAGFLHANLLHIGFNMYLLYVLGLILEPAIGSLRFGALYFASLVAGSFGALLVTPYGNTIGASGAVFGLMGAAVVEARARGISVVQNQIGFLIVINLVFSFTVSGISIGGHIGGLVGGALAALAFQLGERFRSPMLGLGACAALAIAALAGSLAVAGGSGLSG